MCAESLPQTDPPGTTLFACDECWKASPGSAGAGAVDAPACHRNGGGLDLSAACAEAPAGKHATVFPSTHERSPDHPVHQALPAPSVSLWWQRVAKPLLPHAMNESAWLVVSGVRRAPVEGTEQPRPHPRPPPSNADTAQSSEFLKDVDGPRHARARRLHCPRLGSRDRPRRGRPAGGARHSPAHHRPASAGFSWQLRHLARAQSQFECRISVSRLPFSPSLAAAPVWDGGLVRSNRTAAPYVVGGGPAQPLESDADHAWASTAAAPTGTCSDRSPTLEHTRSL